MFFQDLGSGFFPIPDLDPVVTEKAPDAGSGSATREKTLPDRPYPQCSKLKRGLTAEIAGEDPDPKH
jgi:hypothetical protein